MNINDIEGTKARQRHAPRPGAGTSDQCFNQMDYRDVTHVDFKTTRNINPLEPTYIVRDDDNKPLEIGKVQGSNPCVLPPARQDKEFVATSLKTGDIHGCAIGTKGLGNFHTRERRGYKKTNDISDIDNSMPGSLKKCPETTRNLHPLMPDY